MIITSEISGAKNKNGIARTATKTDFTMAFPTYCSGESVISALSRSALSCNRLYSFSLNLLAIKFEKSPSQISSRLICLFFRFPRLLIALETGYFGMRKTSERINPSPNPQKADTRS